MRRRLTPWPLNSCCDTTIQRRVALMRSSLSKMDPTLRFEHAEYLSLLGNFQRLAGDAAGTKSSYTQCRDEMENLWREQTGQSEAHQLDAFAKAGLGEKEAALTLQEQAVAKLHAGNDFFDGPVYEVGLAQLKARFGDKDRALTALQSLLSTNGAMITPARLRLDPAWDSLRDDPRFQKLIATNEQRGPDK